MVNGEPLKISPKAKEFLNRIRLNRIKLDQISLKSFSEAIELMQVYFELNNERYVEMLKGELKC